MRIRSRESDPGAPKTLPRRNQYSSDEDFRLARLRFISADHSVADNDKFILRLAATFEHHKITFNKLYRTLKSKQCNVLSSNASAPKTVFGWLRSPP